MVDGALGIPQLGVDETRMARVRRLAAARRRDWIVRKGQSRRLSAGQLPPLFQDPGLGLCRLSFIYGSGGFQLAHYNIQSAQVATKGGQSKTSPATRDNRAAKIKS